jgi:hypothetical protein
MKKLAIMLILTLGWLKSYCQVEAVFPYNHPSKDMLYNLAQSQTAKGNAYAQYLITRINIGLRDTSYKVSSVDEIFPHLFLEDITPLTAHTYINSGYDPKKKAMVSSLGNAFSGFAWVFRIGSFIIIVIKDDCGNILTVSPIRITPPAHSTPLTQPYEQQVQPRLPSYVEVITTTTKDSVVIKKGISTLGWIGIGAGGAAIVVGAIYLLTHKDKPKDTGGPGGTPANPGTTTPSGGPGGTPPNQGGFARPIGPSIGNFVFGVGFTDYKKIKSNGQISTSHSLSLGATFRF